MIQELPRNGINSARFRTCAVVAILLLAFGLRVAAAFVWQAQADQENTFFRFGDSESYWVLGQSIADGKPYQYHSSETKIFRAPVYPLVLSLTAWIEPQRTAVIASRMVGCGLGTLCVWIIYWITRRVAMDASSAIFPNSECNVQPSLWINSAALLAALFAAIYPGAIGMSVFILSESIFCPLMIGSLVMLYLSLRAIAINGRLLLGSGLIFLLVAGLLSGVANLARPSWLLWSAAVFAVTFISTQRCAQERFNLFEQVKQALAVSVLFTLAVSLAMSPWWIRNYIVTGKFVPTTLQVGASLYDSFHPGASGGSDEGMAFSGEFARELAIERKARQDGQLPADRSDLLPFEYVLDQRLKNAAIEWINSNPSDAAKLVLVKFARTWTPLPKASQLGNSAIKYAEAITYVVILLFGVIGCIKTWKRHRIGVLYAAPCIYFAVIHSVFVGSVRYRQPAILALCVLAGIGTAWIVVKWKIRTQGYTQAN